MCHGHHLWSRGVLCVMGHHLWSGGVLCVMGHHLWSRGVLCVMGIIYGVGVCYVSWASFMEWGVLCVMGHHLWSGGVLCHGVTFMGWGCVMCHGVTFMACGMLCAMFMGCLTCMCHEGGGTMEYHFGVGGGREREGRIHHSAHSTICRYMYYALQGFVYKANPVVFLANPDHP